MGEKCCLWSLQRVVSSRGKEIHTEIKGTSSVWVCVGVCVCVCVCVCQRERPTWAPCDSHCYVEVSYRLPEYRWRHRVPDVCKDFPAGQERDAVRAPGPRLILKSLVSLFDSDRTLSTSILAIR